MKEIPKMLAKVELNLRLREDPENILGLLHDELSKAIKEYGVINDLTELQLLIKDTFGEMLATIEEQQLDVKIDLLRIITDKIVPLFLKEELTTYALDFETLVKYLQGHSGSAGGFGSREEFLTYCESDLLPLLQENRLGNASACLECGMTLLREE